MSVHAQRRALLINGHFGDRRICLSRQYLILLGAPCGTDSRVGNQRSDSSLVKPFRSLELLRAGLGATASGHSQAKLLACKRGQTHITEQPQFDGCIRSRMAHPLTDASAA